MAAVGKIQFNNSSSRRVRFVMIVVYALLLTLFFVAIPNFRYSAKLVVPEVYQ